MLRWCCGVSRLAKNIARAKKELKATFEAECLQVERAHKVEMQTIRDGHVKEKAAARITHDATMEQSAQDRKAAIAQCMAARESAQAVHNASMKKLQASFKAERLRQRNTHAAAVASLQKQHADELQTLADLETSIHTASTALEALKARETALQQQLADASARKAHHEASLATLKASVAEEAEQLCELRMGSKWLQRMTREREGGMVTLIPIDGSAVRCFVSVVENISYFAAAIDYALVTQQLHGAKEEESLCSIHVSCQHATLLALIEVLTATNQRQVLTDMDQKQLQLLAQHEMFTDLDIFTTEITRRIERAWIEEGAQQKKARKIQEIQLKAALFVHCKLHRAKNKLTRIINNEEAYRFHRTIYNQLLRVAKMHVNDLREEIRTIAMQFPDTAFTVHPRCKFERGIVNLNYTPDWTVGTTSCGFRAQWHNLDLRV